jgi:hypothetical protein
MRTKQFVAHVLFSWSGKDVEFQWILTLQLKIIIKQQRLSYLAYQRDILSKNSLDKHKITKLLCTFCRRNEMLVLIWFQYRYL